MRENTYQVKKMKKNHVNQKKKKRLIVRNLSFQVSEKELHDIFSKFGNVSEVTIPVKEDGKKRGFAFVQYEDTASMIKAMKALNYSGIQGRKIAVDYAINKTNYQLKLQSIKQEKQSAEHKSCVNSESDKSDNESAAENSMSSIKKDPEDEKLTNANEFLREFDAEYETVKNDDSSEKSSDDESNAESEETVDEKEVKESQNLSPERFSNSKKNSYDVSEGKTVFLRNVAFTTSQDSLSEAMKEYGECEYCIICVDPYTNHSKGTAFVKFKDKNNADKLIADSYSEPGVLIDGRKLTCTLAVSKEKLSQQNDSLKMPKDKRNLNLLKVGVIMPEESQTISRSDMIKRSQLENLKKQKLRNVNFFISDKRLMVHNLPKTLTDSGLRKLFKQAAGKGAVITEARVMKEFKKTNAEGIPLSKGFGFVSFNKHEDAMKCLLFLNNNPNIFTKQKRPIVEFSVENKVALLTKERRREKIQMRNKKRTEEKKTRVGKNTNNDNKVLNNTEASSKKRNRKKKRTIEQKTDDQMEMLPEIKGSPKKQNWKKKRVINQRTDDQMERLPEIKGSPKKKRKQKKSSKNVQKLDDGEKSLVNIKASPKKKKRSHKSMCAIENDQSNEDNMKNMILKFKEKLLNKI